MHREIAIAKITAYLARPTAVLVNNLPDRTLADAGAPAIGTVNDYRGYTNFLRNHVYTDVEINAFVAETQKAKNLAQITA